MNVDRWFDGQNAFNFTAYPMGIMQDQEGMFKACQNGRRVFGLVNTKLRMKKGQTNLLTRYCRSSLISICLGFFTFVLLFNLSCTKSTETASSFHATPYTIQIPLHFPTTLNVPAGRSMTVEGIALGRYLFYDGRLSGRSDPDSLMCCATCHIQANSFVCGINNPGSVPGDILMA